MGYVRSRDPFHEMNHHRHAGPMGDRRKTMTTADHIEEGLEWDISEREIESDFSLAVSEYENEEGDDLDDMKLVAEALGESDEHIPYEDLIAKIEAKRNELHSALSGLLEEEVNECS